MRLGLISDVHGNKPALETVLEDMPDVDRIYHCGDVVGYNPFPGEILEIFDSMDIESIQGNHDRKISGDVDEMGNLPPRTVTDSEAIDTSDPGTFARLAGQWTNDQLTAAELQFLAALPAEKTIEKDTVKLVHGAPNEQDTRLLPEEYTPALLDEEQVLVHGHTHVQDAERFENRWIVNPGSVGQPRDGDPKAAYAVLDLDTMDVELRRVEYPIQTVIDAIRETSLPDQLCLWLEHGKIITDDRTSK
jgi:putative phosphoesterase